MISIEIPVTHGKYIRRVLDSILSQEGDYEVVIVTPRPEVVGDYRVKVVEADTGLLEARYLAHLNSKGDRELILDETRYLSPGAIQYLSSQDRKMLIIGEEEVGTSFLDRTADLDKRVIMECNSGVDPLRGYLLPRFFQRDVLDHAFSALRKNIPGEIFSRIVHPDHQLIFYEAYRYSRDVGIVKDVLLHHFGDSLVSDTVRKYYRYGKSHELLRKTPYRELLRVSRRKRNLCNVTLKERLGLYILYAIRTLPFLLGLYLSAIGVSYVRAG